MNVMLMPIQSGVNEMESRDVRGLSPRRSGFHFGSVHMGFAMDRVALRWVSLRVVQLYPCQCYILECNSATLRNVATDTLRERDVKKVSGLVYTVTYFTAQCQQPSTLYVRHMAHGEAFLQENVTL